MPCTCPVDAWRPRAGAENRRLVFSPTKGNLDQHVRIPCGQCTGCRLDRALGWATRCVHEAQMHERCAFITPTYSDEHLPWDYSVSVRELQLFNKKLRHEFGPFRFFACGEYGEQFQRPHYHMLVFGLDFSEDRVPWSKSKRGELLWRSPRLEAIWGKGSCLIGSVTLESAGYCARYSLKKITGDRAEDHYRRIHPLTGEAHQVRPEFVTMSRRPGIGSDWFDRYKGDAFPSDFVVAGGRKRPVPGFYKRKLDEAEQARVSAKRKARAALRAADNTEARLLTKHESQDLRAKRLVRSFDGVA